MIRKYVFSFGFLVAKFSTWNNIAKIFLLPKICRSFELLYFPILLIAKFGAIELWMIASSVASQFWKKKNLEIFEQGEKNA